MRQTLFGSLTDEPYPTKNEEAVIYIADVAKSVGIDVNYSDTILDFQFVAKVVKELKESHIKELEEIKAELEHPILDGDKVVIRGDCYISLSHMLHIMDKHIKEDIL